MDQRICDIPAHSAIHPVGVLTIELASVDVFVD
jgi:hypothetical protein